MEDLVMEDQQLPSIDEVVTALRKALDYPYCKRLDKAPTSFDDKLKSSCSSGRRNVLLDTGFQAWFAYFRAEPQAQAAFEQLPDSAAKVVARRLSTVEPHPTVKALFQHIFYKSNRAVARRGWC